MSDYQWPLATSNNRLVTARKNLLPLYHDSLERALRSIYDVIISDDLLMTMRGNSLTREYISERIKQLCCQVFSSEQERVIAKSFEQVDYLNDRIIKLQSQSLRAESTQSKSKELFRNLQQRNNEVKCQQRQLSQHKLKLNRAQDQLFQLRTKLKLSNQEHDLLNSIKEQLKLSQNQRKFIKAQLITAQSEIKRLRQLTVLLQQEKSRHMMESTQHKLVLDQLIGKTRQFQSETKHILQSQRQEIGSLTNENDRLTSQLQEVASVGQSQLRSIKEKYGGQVTRLKSLLKQSKHSHKEKDEGHQSAINQKKEQIIKLSSHNRELMDTVRKLSIQTEQLNEQIYQRSGLCQRLKKQNELRIQQNVLLITKEKQLQEALQKNMHQLCNSERTRAELQDSLFKTQIQNDKDKHLISTFKCTLSTLQNQIETRSRKMSQLTQSLRTTKCQRQSLESDYNSLKKEASRLKSELEDASHKLRLNQQSLYSTKRSLEDQTLKLQRKEEEFRSLLQSCNQLKKTQETLLLDLQDLRATLKLKSEENRKLDRLSHQLHIKLEYQGSKATSSHERTAQLQAQVKKYALKLQAIERQLSHARDQEFKAKELLKSSRVLTAQQSDQITAFKDKQTSLQRLTSTLKAELHQTNELLSSQRQKRARAEKQGQDSEQTHRKVKVLIVRCLKALRDEVERLKDQLKAVAISFFRFRQNFIYELSDSSAKLQAKCLSVLQSLGDRLIGNAMIQFIKTQQKFIKQIDLERKAFQLGQKEYANDCLNSFKELQRQLQNKHEKCRSLQNELKQNISAFDKLQLLINELKLQNSLLKEKNCSLSQRTLQQIKQLQAQKQLLRNQITRLGDQVKRSAKQTEQQFYQQQVKIKQGERQILKLEEQKSRLKKFYEQEIELVQKQNKLRENFRGKVKEKIQFSRPSRERPVEEDRQKIPKKSTPADKILAQLKQQIINQKMQLSSRKDRR